MNSPFYKAMYENERKYEIEFEANVYACKAEFASVFGESEAAVNHSSLICVAAPGRVNLIGEHIDYNDGFVFPMAIPLYTVIVGAANNRTDQLCRVKSLEASLGEHNTVEFSLAEQPLKAKEDKSFYWANYLIGVVANFLGPQVPSFDAVIKSNVPLGSGLSSSAALEVAMYTLLESLTNRE